MKVLLISNKVYHYRIPVYNYFYSAFKKSNFEFSLLTNAIQRENPNHTDFQYTVLKPSIHRYLRYVNEKKPDVVIFFMHLKDWYMWPLLPYLQGKKIPIIYWGHGVNLQDSHNVLKKALFNLLFSFSNAILLYSPDQKKYISKKYHSKIFIAYNTLNLHSFPKIDKDKTEIKREMKIPYDIVVLFVGRVRKYKKLDILLKIFQNFSNPNAGLVIVGPGISEEQLSIVNTSEKMMYLGAVYDEYEINSVFKMADIFCIPGTNGLGLNQAMFWGVPVVTMEGKHAPEIVYLKNGFNGYLTQENSVPLLQEKLELLASNKDLITELSQNARKTMLQEGDISNMFSEFLKAINYVLKSSTGKI